MSEVPRYTPVGYSRGMEADKCGRWVRWADVERRIAELEGLTKQQSICIDFQKRQIEKYCELWKEELMKAALRESEG